MPALWSRLQGILFGGAIGAAASDAVRPVLEPVRQEAWLHNQNRVIDPGVSARLVAQAVWELAAAKDEGARSGFDASRMESLVQLALDTPDVGEALALYRRKQIGKPELHQAFAKHQIEPQWWPWLEVLAEILLSPAEVANGVQQGHLANDGILPSPGDPTPPPEGYRQATAPDGQPPTNVPLTQINLDPIVEAAGSGVDLPRLKVLANLAGLPPGAEGLLTMRNRNLITEDALDAGLREGHLKTKWLEAYKRMRWWIPSPQDAAGARLRTWITAEESYEIGELHGVSKKWMDLLFLNRGRPASPTQMWRAWARKATGPRGVPVSYEDHAKAIAISDIRPEYAEMLWQIRFNYPSLFQLGRLVTAGTVDADTAALWAENNLYAPDVVKALHAAWTLDAPSKADPNVKKAQTQLWTATHKSFVARESGSATVRKELARLHVADDDQDEILALWGAERNLIHAQLSPSDIRKALDKGVVNPATGQPWSLPDAKSALIERGYDENDAQTYLTTPPGGNA